MQKTAMDRSLAQARLLTTIECSGLTDAQLAAVLGVNQSTVSRLKNGLIRKVAKYQLILDARLASERPQDGQELSELVAMAKVSPTLRDALLAIQRLMRESA